MKLNIHFKQQSQDPSVLIYTKYELLENIQECRRGNRAAPLIIAGSTGGTGCDCASKFGCDCE